MPTISLCMIVKNEEAIIEKCIGPLTEFVDEIIVVDTGSTDNTIPILEKLGCRVEHFDWIDDFAAARNYSFSFATKEWIMWLDADDIVSDPSKIKSIIEHRIQLNPNVNCVVLPYAYNRDEFGNNATTLVRERFLKNNGSWTWERRVHEYLVYPQDAQIAIDSTITIVHAHAINAGARAPRRNLDILEKELAEVGLEKADPRLLAYIGEERRANGDPLGAVRIWQEYLKIGTWVEERYQVFVKMARILLDHNEVQDALKYVGNAYMTLPQWPDVDLFYADFFLHNKEYDKSIYFADECLKKGIPDTVLILQPLDFTFTPLMIKAKAYSLKNELEKAAVEFDKAIAMRPAPEIMQERYRLQSAINGQRVVSSAVEISSLVDEEHIKDFLYALPADLRQSPPMQDVEFSRLWINKVNVDQSGNGDADIFVGVGLEPWDKTNINGAGIGGSETAVVHVADALQKAGYRVTVYGNPPKQGVIDGILYTHARYFNPKKQRSILISSRIPQIFNDIENCGIKVLYLHDINVGDALDERTIANIDKFVFVSEYQRNHYQMLYGEGITEENSVVVSNGIDVESIKSLEVTKRDPYRMIWSSSPDRGLVTLLQMFPAIRAKYPKANLHIFYGWDNIDKVIAMGNENLRGLKEQVMRLVQQPRVFWRGRVSQEQLHKEMLKSSAWLYPTTFLETNCITALECRACGVYPIVSQIGALQETVGKEGTMIPGSPAYAEVEIKFINELVNYLELSDEVKAAWYSSQREKIEKYDWKNIGAEFVKNVAE
jgi:glycosyltransferase involved in cell wall biosynthesis